MKIVLNQCVMPEEWINELLGRVKATWTINTQGRVFDYFEILLSVNSVSGRVSIFSRDILKLKDR